MNCHGNDHQGEEQAKKKGLFSHGILMILCCAIPILLLLALPYLNIGSIGTQGILSAGIFLLCPLMHIGMMAFMFKGKKDKNNSKDGDSEKCH